MGFETDSPPFPLSARASEIRAMAQNTRARSANGDNRNREEPEQNNEQNELFRGLIEEVRKDREERRRQEMMPRQLAHAPEVFKPPEYNGTGSIEVFIRQFLDVSEVNEWTERAAVLHLRRALKEEARDCGGSSETLGEIFTSLRARFGITSREAKLRLNSARKEYSMPLQSHATRIKELVGIAYPDMPRRVQEQMTLDQFINTLGLPRLQEHLLAIRPDTLIEAITAGNEFLQIRGGQRVKKMEVKESDREHEEEQVKPVQASPKVNPAHLPSPYGPAVFGRPATEQPTPSQLAPGLGQQGPGMINAANLPGAYGPTELRQPAFGQPGSAQPAPMPDQRGQQMIGQAMQMAQAGPVAPGPVLYSGGVTDPMSAIMAAVAQLTQSFSTLQQNLGRGRTPERRNQREQKPPLKCWHCGKEGHIKTRCPQFTQEQGNKGGQQ